MESRGTLLVRAGNLTVNLPEEFEGQTAVSERGDCSRAKKYPRKILRQKVEIRY